MICTGQTENEGGIIDLVGNLDTIDTFEISRAIESIIRITSMNMKNEEARKYFITELKKYIKNQYGLCFNKY